MEETEKKNNKKRQTNTFNLVDGTNKTELPVRFDQKPLTNNLNVCFYLQKCIFFNRQEPKCSAKAAARLYDLGLSVATTTGNFVI